jgi:hypothetical protein
MPYTSVSVAHTQHIELAWTCLSVESLAERMGILM